MGLWTVLLIFLFSFDAFATKALDPYCHESNTGRCDFYRECVESSRPCGSRGYAITYGLKYCEKFDSLELDNPEAARWRDATMVCLQQFLLETLRQTIPMCSRLRSEAFDSHVKCYLNPVEDEPSLSICHLPKVDIIRILRTIQARDLLSSESSRQVRAVSRECLKYWTLLDSPFDKADVDRSKQEYLDLWKSF